jgi:hypothetical protein
VPQELVVAAAGLEVLFVEGVLKESFEEDRVVGVEGEELGGRVVDFGAGVGQLDQGIEDHVDFTAFGMLHGLNPFHQEIHKFLAEDNLFSFGLAD